MHKASCFIDVRANAVRGGLFRNILGRTSKFYRERTSGCQSHSRSRKNARADSTVRTDQG